MAGEGGRYWDEDVNELSIGRGPNARPDRVSGSLQARVSRGTGLQPRPLRRAHCFVISKNHCWRKRGECLQCKHLTLALL